MSDIVERLRWHAGYEGASAKDLLKSAADTIEALRAELDILKGDMPARAAILKLAEQNTEIETLRAENARLLSRIEGCEKAYVRLDETERRLREALKPFAELSFPEGLLAHDLYLVHTKYIRAARAAMGEAE